MALRAAKREEAAAQSPSPGATATGYRRVFNGAGHGPSALLQWRGQTVAKRIRQGTCLIRCFRRQSLQRNACSAPLGLAV